MNYLSLFSGIEAATVAWEPLGWACKGVAEIEPFPCAVLAHRLGATAPRYRPAGKDFAEARYAKTVWGDRIPNLGDVSQATDSDVAALGPIDVVIGGSPCQDLSVAGKRAGLAGARSSLFHEQLRIFHAARTLCGARFLIWENVSGAFSSNRGKDFAVVVGTMAGCELAVPRDGWRTEGVVLGDTGLVEWCVLDAQWRGLAQRRRRVFAVLDTGNWADRPPVLLEPQSLRGDSAPRREAGQNPAGTIRAGAGKRGGIQDQSGPEGLIPADIAPTIPSRSRSRSGGGLGTDFDCDGGLIAMGSGQAGAEVVTDGGAPTLTCLHEAPIDYGSFMQGAANTLLKGGHANNPLDETLIPVTAHTLRGDGFDASEDGTGRGTPLVPVVFDTTQITSAANYSNPKPGDPCHPLAAGSHPSAQAGETGKGDSAPSHVSTGMAVRRLTPDECEKLQGFPPGWTAIPWKGKPATDCPDGPRYKGLGNSMATPVILWIGQQLQRAADFAP